MYIGTVVVTIRIILRTPVRWCFLVENIKTDSPSKKNMLTIFTANA